MTKKNWISEINLKKGILVGIGGGTGSGKTLIAKNIFQNLGSEEAVIIQQDSYYKDLSDIPFYERDKRNFDHPDAWDWNLLSVHIRQLLNGESIGQPVYDFKKHCRSGETVRVGPHKIIVIEGILVLHDYELRKNMDIKVYVETPDDIRLIRRVRRDIHERGRSVDSVFHQYENSVRPMHLRFVEPSKQFADIIIPEGGMNVVAVDLLKTKIASLIANS